MLQLWVIALLATVYMHDQIVEGLHRHAPAQPLEWWRVGMALLPMAAIAGMVQVVCVASGREMDRHGSNRAVATVDRMMLASGFAVVLTHALNVFALGWVEQVRAVVGDTIMLDELIAVAPALLVFIAGWWSQQPIEARLHRATLVRVLEEGHPAYPERSRWQFVWSNIRHQMLFVLVPVGLMGCWAEAMNRTATWAMAHQHEQGALGAMGGWLAHSPLAEAARFVVQLVGIAAVFMMAPVLMRVVWDAVPLGPGPLRDRLLTICARSGVRVRELLVWRTYGTMMNGAAMGLIAPLRYILLTDALLDHLPGRQVESVMAHEVGHAKHHHIPWLVLGMMAAMGVIGIGAAIGVTVVVVGMSVAWQGSASGLARAAGIAEMTTMPLILVLGFASFGWISRRFEWQADAFAAKALSREGPQTSSNGGMVTQEAVEAMCGALGTVSSMSHVDPERWSFRHGSIATRQRKLMALAGRPLDRLPIDRLVFWIKGGIVVGIAILVMAIGSMSVAETFVPRWLAREKPRYDIQHFQHRLDQSTPEDAP